MSTFQQLIETYGKQLSVSCDHYRLLGKLGTIGAERIRSVNLKFDGALFASVMRQLEITFEGKQDITIYDRFNNLTLTVSADGESESINYGRFHVHEKPVYDEATNTTKVLCYDEMHKAMNTYKLDTIIFPITLGDYLQAIATELGISIKNINELKNADMTIDHDPYYDVATDEGIGYTYRDVLDEIARCAGCSFAFKSTANGNTADSMYIIYVTDGNGNMNASVAELDISNLKSLSVGEHYGRMDSVMLSRQPQEDNVILCGTGIAKNNAKFVKLKQPEIAEGTDAEREAWLPALIPAVNGIEYDCYELESFGIACLNFGDVFTIKSYSQSDGLFDYSNPVTYKSVFMRTDMTVDTDIKEKSVLEMPVATDVNYSIAATAGEKALKTAYLKVDKKIGEIEGYLYDPVEGLETKISAMAGQISSAVSDASGAKSQVAQLVTEITSKVTKDEVESIIKQEADLITLSVKGSLNKGNLLPDSECFEHHEFIRTSASADENDYYITASAESNVPSGKKMLFSLLSNGVGTGVCTSTVIDKDTIKPGRKYTFSFWARNNTAGETVKLDPDFIFSYDNDGNNQIVYDNEKLNNPDLTPSWQKYSCTFSANASLVNPVFFNFRFSDSSVGKKVRLYISSLMLTEGEDAVAWSAMGDNFITESEFSSGLESGFNGGVCANVLVNRNGLTVENGALTLKDSRGEAMIDSEGIHSEYLNFGTTKYLETINNGSYISQFDDNGTYSTTGNLDVWSIRNYSGTDTGINNAKAAVNVMMNIPELIPIFINNSNNWFCNCKSESDSTANIVWIGHLDVSATQTYLLEYDIIIGSTSDGSGLEPNKVVLKSDESIKYSVGINSLAEGSCAVNGRIYKYRYGKLKCSLRGYDLIKKKKGRSETAFISIGVTSLFTEYDAMSALAAMQKPTQNYFGFIGNIKLSTFEGATLNARAILNSNTDYFYDLGTGIFFADEVGCNNIRISSIPRTESTSGLYPVYTNPETGELFRKV